MTLVEVPQLLDLGVLSVMANPRENLGNVPHVSWTNYPAIVYNKLMVMKFLNFHQPTTIEPGSRFVTIGFP